MNIAVFTALVCTLTQPNCEQKAQEYWQSAQKYKFDPVLLVAIAIYECDLRDKVVHHKLPKDLCPMGLRVYDNKKWTRAQIIDEAANRLDFFRIVTRDHRERFAYLNHYNSGFLEVHNKYGWQVNGIYNTLLHYKLTTIEQKKLNKRTQTIIKELNELFSRSTT